MKTLVVRRYKKSQRGKKKNPFLSFIGLCCLLSAGAKYVRVGVFALFFEFSAGSISDDRA